MISSLFQAVLSASFQMTFPILFILLPISFWRKHIKASTLFKIEKAFFVGLAMVLILSGVGPIIQISTPAPILSTQLPFRMSDASLKSTEKISPEIIDNTKNVIVYNTNPIFRVLGIIWIVGFVLIVFFTMFQYASFAFSVCHNCFTVPPVFEKLYQQQCQELKIKKAPDVKVSPKLLSPITIGWIHPTIILSFQNLSDSYENVKLLFKHELSHCKQKDNVWRTFISLVLSVYWFHPLVWCLFYSFSLENEIACDEKVLQDSSARIKNLYARLLVSTIEEESTTKSSITLQSSLKSNFKATKLRILQMNLVPKYKGMSLLYFCLFNIVLFSGIIRLNQVNNTSSLWRISVPALTIFDGSEQYVSTLILRGSNQKGYAEEKVSAQLPNDSFFIVPLRDYHIVNQKNYDEEGNTYRSILYFFPHGENKEVVACTDGVIAALQTKEIERLEKSEKLLRTYGKYVVLDCGNGITVRYAFLDSIAVEPGQKVSTGDVLGIAGHTGLSYGDTDQCGIFVMQDGVMVDPLPFFEINAPIQEVS